jgi:hypothetical protein
MTGDCRTCQHNSYHGTRIEGWVSCCHPVTLAKSPRWEKGDPAFVNWMTGDVHVSRIDEIGECPVYEPVKAMESSDD